MKKIMLFAAAALTIAACSPKAPKVAGIDYANLDTTVRPGDDFAQYATGHWIDNNPQPAEYANWSTTVKVFDDNIKALSAIFEEMASKEYRKGSNEQKIGDLYKMALDSVRLNAEGVRPLQKYLDKIRSAQTREDLDALLAHDHDDLFFDIFIAADEKDSKNNIVNICQGGLSLKNKDYYTATDPRSVNVVNATKMYSTRLFTLVGYSEEEAAAKVGRIWEIETELAQYHYSNEKQRDSEANYHKMSVAELTELCNGFDWDGYLKARRYDKTSEVNVCQPEPVAKGCELLSSLSVEDLKSIYELGFIKLASMCLSDDFSDAAHEYSNAIYGIQEKAPRWKNAQQITDNILSDAIGQIFVKKYFSKAAKKDMLEMIDNLRASLGERIQAQEWMCDSTKAKALDKLASFKVKVGYPDKWEDLSGLSIDPELSLFDNMYNASEFMWEKDYEKHYNKPVDSDEWLLPAQMVNAYYNPTTNEICFPAGFLQPPLYDINSDAAANYGSIGMVIGHEMTHGFDDQGRLYTKEGNMQDWWAESDAEGFEKACQGMVDYFNTLWVIPGELKANGTLTLGENIADHGGLNVAFNAFQRWQDKHGRLPEDNGFSPEQRFFLSYANVWAGVSTPEMLSYRTMADVHSVTFLRINGALAQCGYWYNAFDIQPDNAMYVAPEDRVNVW